MHRRLILLAVVVATTALAAGALPGVHRRQRQHHGDSLRSRRSMHSAVVDDVGFRVGWVCREWTRLARGGRRHYVHELQLGSLDLRDQRHGMSSGPAGSWTLADDWLNCDGSLNRYGLYEFELPERFSGTSLITTPRTVRHYRPRRTRRAVRRFNAGESETLGFQIAMPCVGSSGAGQSLSFSIAMTATVA